MSCRISPSQQRANIKESVFAAPASPAALLQSVPPDLRGEPLYAYIVTTIKTTPGYQLQQTGSAPNFDGGRITLCTCKHKDRATFRPSNDQQDPWKNVWVAGLTSKTADPSRSLAYLMCVERSFLSQWELWHKLPDKCRQAKSASKSALGDLFVPKPEAADDQYNPDYYHPPNDTHVHRSKAHPSLWHRDIQQWGRRSIPHRLLLSQAKQSYRWQKVKMILEVGAMGSSAHHRMYASLEEFVGKLQPFDP